MVEYWESVGFEFLVLKGGIFEDVIFFLPLAIAANRWENQTWDVAGLMLYQVALLESPEK